MYPTIIDIINYGMLKAIQAKGFNTYVTYTTEDEHKVIPKDITGIEVPFISVRNLIADYSVYP